MVDVDPAPTDVVIRGAAVTVSTNASVTTIEMAQRMELLDMIDDRSKRMTTTTDVGEKEMSRTESGTRSSIHQDFYLPHV